MWDARYYSTSLAPLSPSLSVSLSLSLTLSALTLSHMYVRLKNATPRNAQNKGNTMKTYTRAIVVCARVRYTTTITNKLELKMLLSCFWVADP